MTPQIATAIILGLVVLALPIFAMLLALILDEGIDRLLYGPDEDKDDHPWGHL